jgi:hypothetical protein
MKKNYQKFKRNLSFFACAMIFMAAGLKAQGPVTTQTFVYTGTVQNFTVPPLCVNTITIDARGAQGGNFAPNTGGLGARIVGEVAVTPGAVLAVRVGGQGTASQNAGGGGGGSGVSNGATPLVVAGGGGGACSASNENGQGASIGNAGTNSSGLGGINGLGGQKGYVSGDCGWAGGGGGFLGNGYGGDGSWDGGPLPGTLSGPAAGFAAVNGGAGGLNGGCNFSPGLGAGGFGCGGGGRGEYGGGGGGGYSGGGAGQYVSPAGARGGGGGGSYNAGIGTQINTPNFQSGNGVVIISYVGGTAMTVAATPSIVCAGNPSTLTASGVSTYTWFNGSNSTTVVVSPNVATTYTIVGTNSVGCTSSLAISVPVNTAVPTLTVVNSASVVCAGKPSTLTASGALSYTWAGGVSPANGVGFIPAATTDYTVSGSNACGTTTAVTSITVNPLPNIGGAANNPTVCFGTQVILNGTGSAGGYTWTSGFPNNTAFTPPVGINNYTVTGSGANSCTNSAVVSVTAYLTPTVTPVVTPTAICVGKTATLSATGAANGYTWSAGPPGPSTVAVSPVVTTTYSVIRATGACTSIATVTVVVNPLPNLLVGAPNPPTICAGTCATVTGQGAITYTWFPGGFQGGVITVCPNSSTNYTVVASNANCTTSATSSVTVLPNPVLSIQVTTTTPCAGSEITMTVTGASNYTWTSPISVPQQNQSVVTHSPTAPVQYNVSGTDANGCTSTINQVIIPQAAPNLTTSIVNTGSFICAGQIGTLVAQGTGQINYNWLPNGASTGTTTVNPPVSTVYTVTGINPSTGCMSTATLSLAVYISTFVTTTNPLTLCKGNTATLSVAGAANNYTWTAGSPNNNDSIFVNPQTTTVYYVTGITGNCSTTQSINLVVNPIPPVTGVAQKITICRFEPGILMGSGAGASGSYSWTGGPGASTQNFTVFPTVTTTYTLTGTDVNGCSKTVQVTQLVATCIGIEEQSPLAGLLNIFPNPSSGEFTIQAATSMNITIINELGQMVKSFPVSGKETTVKVNDLANGIYFILAEKDGNTSTQKMVIGK